MAPINPLWIALVAMFFQQTLTTIAKSIVPLIAPAALPDLGVSAAYTGVFIGLSAFVQVFVMMGCGGVIRRLGGVRTSQLSLVLVFAGMLSAASGSVWPFLVTAVLVPLGTSAATPASSQILARYAPPKYAPLVFSVKQTAVPFSLMVAGVLVPFLVHLFGWQGAFLAFGALCLAYAVILQPTRAELDRDRDPTRTISPADAKSTFTGVMRAPALRRLGLAGAAYVGLQVTFLTYFVLFLTEQLGYSLAAAGALYATATAASIPMRIVWGWLAGTWLHPRTVLIGLGLIMTVASILIGTIGPGWAHWQVLGAAFLLTSTALSWQGVFLSEIARLSPKGEVGAMTGGVLAISAMGQMTLPLLFSAVLALTGSYGLGFYAVAVPPLAVMAMLVFARDSKPAPAPAASAD